jgi:hypothetical protein
VKYRKTTAKVFDEQPVFFVEKNKRVKLYCKIKYFKYKVIMFYLISIQMHKDNLKIVNTSAMQIIINNYTQIFSYKNNSIFTQPFVNLSILIL